MSVCVCVSRVLSCAVCRVSAQSCLNTLPQPTYTDSTNPFPALFSFPQQSPLTSRTTTTTPPPKQHQKVERQNPPAGPRGPRGPACEGMYIHMYVCVYSLECTIRFGLSSMSYVCVLSLFVGQLCVLSYFTFHPCHVPNETGGGMVRAGLTGDWSRGRQGQRGDAAGGGGHHR